MLKNKNSTGSLNLIKDIFKYLSQKRKIQLFLTIISGFASGFAEMINLSAVVPDCIEINWTDGAIGCLKNRHEKNKPLMTIKRTLITIALLTSIILINPNPSPYHIQIPIL